MYMCIALYSICVSDFFEYRTELCDELIASWKFASRLALPCLASSHRVVVDPKKCC